MKRKIQFIYLLVLLVQVLLISRSAGQAPLPAADFSLVSAAVQKDFGSIDAIYTVGMTDDIGGRFDMIVVGSCPRNRGWRVMVFSIKHHKLSTKWDSVTVVNAPEYVNSGPQSVKVQIMEYDYNLIVEGCAPHKCSDGISGFLVFSGRTGEISKAKVTRLYITPDMMPPRYDVTFSPNIGSVAKAILMDEICTDQSISNKSGLPFECKKR